MLLRLLYKSHDANADSTISQEVIEEYARDYLKIRGITSSMSVINGAIEETAVFKLSPARVIRAIAALVSKWKMKCLHILTERKFGK